jgi:transposase-like protein
MASKEFDSERLQALLAEFLAAQVAEGELGIEEIEEAMVQLGDAVAREYAARAIARQTARPPEQPPCPDCQHPGERAGQRERELITRRGPVPIREAKYRCPKCRRHFFPSVGAVGA